MVGCLQCKEKTNNSKFCSLSCSTIYNNKRKIYPSPKTVKCLECGVETRNKKFCSHSCSAGYNNKHRIFKADAYKGEKTICCCICQKEIRANMRSPNTKTKCRECKLETRRLKKKCNYCGENKCTRPDICKKYNMLPTLIQYFGFDESVIGTIKIYEEFEKIKNILHEEYHNNELSINGLINKFCGDGKPTNDAFYKMFKSLGLECRNISEAVKISVYNGRGVPSSPKYKQGWHTTWNDKKVYYRSSYELNYCKILDKQKIDYEMESKRFWYWDSQQQKQRVAIPDFYISEDNLIVEIKSNYTLDEQNMRDKVKAYREHGYCFKLIVNGKEMSIVAG